VLFLAWTEVVTLETGARQGIRQQPSHFGTISLVYPVS
jgi:hypothetical protein